MRACGYHRPMTSRVWCAALAVLAALAAGRGARADTLPGAGGFLIEGSWASARESHGWVIVPDSGSTRFIVLHIPARGVMGGGVVADGTVAVAARIDSEPEQIAATGATVYLAFPAEPARPGERLRRVLRVTASLGAIGDTWQYDAGERLQAEPSLPGTGRLLGFAGAGRGPVALLDGDPADELTLLALEGDAWRRLPLPDAGEGRPLGVAPPPILIGTSAGPALLVRDRSRAGIWTSQWAAEAGVPGSDGPPDPPAVVWSWRPLEFADGAGASLDGPVFAVDGRLIMIDREGPSTVALWSTEGERALLLGRVEGLTNPFAVAPLEQSGRLVFVCPVRAPSPRGAPQRPATGFPEAPRYEYHIREVSAATGRTLYTGPPSRASPLSASEFRLLVVLLLGVTVAIVLFVLRPTGSPSAAPLALPEQTALAEPGRRMAAAVLDLAPALLLASRLSGVAPWEALTLDGLLSGGDGLALLLDALALAFAHTTVCEWAFRRSLGKALAGCEVARVVFRQSGADGELLPTALRPAFWRVAVRNLVKWGLAPVAFAGMTGPERRHVGDRLSGVTVLVRTE